jgi:hypothetical protein
MQLWALRFDVVEHPLLFSDMPSHPVTPGNQSSITILEYTRILPLGDSDP